MTNRTFKSIWKRTPVYGIPNNPHLPAALVAGAISDATERTVRRRYEENGWTGTWTWTVFDYHHFHSASHEALACIGGWGELMLGGRDGPTVRIARGDVIVLPAGFGHCLVASGDNFTVVGAYPAGQANPEILKADRTRVEAWLKQIAATALPEHDPFFGESGPLMSAWSQ